MNNNKTNQNDPINTTEYYGNYESTGLTKREYFAAMAMQGFLSNPNSHSFSKKEFAISSVEMADALIKELNKECATFNNSEQ